MFHMMTRVRPLKEPRVTTVRGAASILVQVQEDVDTLVALKEQQWKYSCWLDRVSQQ